jgi:hypothetical protein
MRKVKSERITGLVPFGVHVLGLYSKKVIMGSNLSRDVDIFPHCFCCLT